MIHVTETILISKLRENPKNIRKHFDEEFIDRLADSVKRFGIISPIVALRDGTVVAGNQRFRAAKRAGLKELVVGRDVLFIDGKSGKDVDTINAIENIMRRQLNVFEEAEGLWRILHDHMGFKNPAAAFDFAFRAYKAYLDDDVTPDEQPLLDLTNSLGISMSRAYMLLSAFKLSPAATKYLRERIVDADDMKASTRGRGTVTLTAIFQLSTIQPKHQLMMAKGVMHKDISAQSIRKVYNQWLEGLRNDNLDFKGSKKQQAELESVRSAIDRRERTMKAIEERGEPTTKSFFSFAALSTDLKILRSDIDVALKTLKTDLAMPEYEENVVKGLPFTIEDVEADLGKLKAACRAKTKALLAPKPATTEASP